jgi:NAD(P)-dependent dehydrogenase (short-subunit alcohol dehydrogenase family)
MKAQTPLGVIIEPRDTADAVLFLVSDAGRYITGINLNVNAGTMIL